MVWLSAVAVLLAGIELLFRRVRLTMRRRLNKSLLHQRPFHSQKHNCALKKIGRLLGEISCQKMLCEVGGNTHFFVFTSRINSWVPGFFTFEIYKRIGCWSANCHMSESRPSLGITSCNVLPSFSPYSVARSADGNFREFVAPVRPLPESFPVYLSD